MEVIKVSLTRLCTKDLAYYAACSRLKIKWEISIDLYQTKLVEQTKVSVGVLLITLAVDLHIIGH